MAKQKQFLDTMLDMYGDEQLDQVFITSKNAEEVVTPISTGSLSLDVSIGIGGIPKRRYTVLDGPEGSGKSTVALSIARNAIRQGDRVLYVDVENQMHISYIEQLLGEPLIDSERFIIAKPENSDDTFKIMESAIASKEFGLIVLDSIAALSSPEEQENPWDKSTMMVIPRDIAKFLRRNSFKVRTNNVAVLFINQVRDTVGSYVKSYSTPGGHALKHYASVIISLTKGEGIKAGDEIIGINTKFTIKKNKLAPPFRSHIIPIIFGVGVDTLRDLVDYAERLGVLRKAGPYYKFGDDNLGRGMLNTMEFLENNKEVLDKIREMCYNIVSRLNNKTESEEVNEPELGD